MEIHEEWLFKANSDLESAKVLLKNNLLDTAIYHTQQSAEKALKGYLAEVIFDFVKEKTTINQQ